MSWSGRWWTEAGMTGPDAIARAAGAAGVLVDAHLDDDDPAVLVEAHGGPWKITPGPMGWWAVQALDTGYGGWHEVPDTAGWLGVGDLEPDRVIGNLLESEELASNWRDPADRPVSTRRVPDDEARARLRLDSDGPGALWADENRRAAGVDVGPLESIFGDDDLDDECSHCGSGIRRGGEYPRSGDGRVFCCYGCADEAGAELTPEWVALRMTEDG